MTEKCVSAHPSPILTSLSSPTRSLQSFHEKLFKPIIALTLIKM